MEEVKKGCEFEILKFMYCDETYPIIKNDDNFVRNNIEVNALGICFSECVLHIKVFTQHMPECSLQGTRS